MPEIQQPHCLNAWQAGVRLIQANRGDVFNLLTTIENPGFLDPTWLELYSPAAVASGADRVADVIGTVFPIGLNARYPNRPEFYEAYLRLHRRAMRWPRNRSRWGTYFERLIAFAGDHNQLEIAITKLRTWPQRNTTGLVFHLSSPLLDSPRTRGGPCWHFGEILWRQGNVLDFVAVYRNHDFFNKALGNFIAIGQLLQFIANASNMTAGKLICHSIHAYSEKSSGPLSRLARI